jgi:hypothetical protein
MAAEHSTQNGEPQRARRMKKQIAEQQIGRATVALRIAPPLEAWS